MADENNSGNDNVGDPTGQGTQANSGTQTPNDGAVPSQADMDKLIAERVDQQLADIKAKLDKSYQARDAALAQLEAVRLKEKEAEIKALEESGKIKEAAELRMLETNAKLTAAQQKIVELTRDASVKDALQGLEFRSKAAAEMATREIIGQLVQDKDGNWVHKSGTPIQQFVEAFSKSDEQSFLFKPLASSGAGTGSAPAGTTNSGEKSLFKLSQAEVLKLASEGKIGVR